jgi:DUF4097 and DUF4098 domain-containing protein YvlB
MFGWIRGVVLTVALTGVVHAQTPIDEVRPAAPDVAIEVSNVKGSVDVSVWEKPSVEITGTLGKGTERLDIDASEKRQSIKVVLPSKSKSAKDTHLRLRVPKGATVYVTCVSAGITVDGVAGDLELMTVSGSVRASGVAGRVEAETVSGGVTIEGSSANVEAKAVSGSIKIRTAQDRVDASTVSGSITVEGESIERLECKAVSGSIKYVGSVAPNGNVELKTHSGGITLSLPAATEARFELSSFSGDIRSDLGDAEVSRPKYGPGSSLDFVTGSGSARIEAHVFSGGITVSRL